MFTKHVDLRTRFIFYGTSFFIYSLMAFGGVLDLSALLNRDKPLFDLLLTSYEFSIIPFFTFIMLLGLGQDSRSRLKVVRLRLENHGYPKITLIRSVVIIAVIQVALSLFYNLNFFYFIDTLEITNIVELVSAILILPFSFFVTPASLVLIIIFSFYFASDSDTINITSGVLYSFLAGVIITYHAIFFIHPILHKVPIMQFRIDETPHFFVLLIYQIASIAWVYSLLLLGKEDLDSGFRWISYSVLILSLMVVINFVSIWQMTGLYINESVNPKELVAIVPTVFSILTMEAYLLVKRRRSK